MLTRNPNIGSELYSLVKNKTGTRRAIQVYQEVQKQSNAVKSK